MEVELYQTLYEIEKVHWWFAARRKILDILVKQVISGYKNVPRILDIGCSTGITTEFLRRHGWICGVDFCREALRFCHKQDISILVQADACNLPFLAESYEVIVALDLLEHIQEDKRAIREFGRVLKRDGFLIVFVPAYKILWGRLDDIAHHRRRYRLKELREKLNKEGFEIKKISYINCMLFFAILISRLTERLFRNSSQSKADLKVPGRVINSMMEKIFSCEARFIDRFNFPFGSSIACVAQNKNFRE